MTYSCPVCFYDKLPFPPADYHICPSCGTEFGNDDAEISHEQLREMWIAGGANWFFGKPPENWNPWTQLQKGGVKAITGRAPSVAHSEELVFPVVVESDADGYFAFSPTLQGCYSQGDTYEEMIENIKDAIRLHVEDRRASGEEIPQNVFVTLSTVEVTV